MIFRQVESAGISPFRLPFAAELSQLLPVMSVLASMNAVRGFLCRICCGIAGLLLAAGHPVSGSTFFSASDSSLVISQMQVIDDDLFLFAERLTLDGTVSGDLFSFTARTELNGSVGGSVHVVAENCIHDGFIDGGLRVMASDLTVRGVIRGNLLALGNQATLESEAVIEHDATIYGGTVSIAGTTKGDVTVRSDQLLVSGHVGGDLTLYGERMRISQPAIILGNLVWESKHESDLVIDSGVTIVGTRQWKSSESDQREAEENSLATDLIFSLSSLAAALLFGLLLLWAFRPHVEQTGLAIVARPTVALAVGIVGAMVAAVCLIVLLVAVAMLVVGLAILTSSFAMLGFFLLVISIVMLPVTSFLSLSGAILLYAGPILLAPVIGWLLLRRHAPLTTSIGVGTLLIGLVAIGLLEQIPIAGTVVTIAAALVGTGGLLMSLRSLPRRDHQFQPPATGEPQPSEPFRP